MACNDCPKPDNTTIQSLVFQAPTGYTGCALSSLARALPEPLVGTEYDLPRIAQDGTIIYAGHGQPPPDINGYVRDPDDAWRFRPLWNECAMRIHGTSRNRRSGAINVIMVCNHSQSAVMGSRLVHTDCANCTLRFPRNDRQ